MDPQTSERWVLDRHAEMIRRAARYAALTPEARCRPRLPIIGWTARRLRSLADRLEGTPHLHRA